MTFSDISVKLPDLFKDLLDQPKHPFKTLTQGTISSLMDSNSPVPGIFLMWEKDDPVYVGRSRHLAQRVGTDLRAITREQANLSYKLAQLGNIPGVNDISTAREYMYKTYTVQIMRLDDVIERTLLQVYCAVELNTRYNSFIES